MVQILHKPSMDLFRRQMNDLGMEVKRRTGNVLQYEVDTPLNIKSDRIAQTIQNGGHEIQRPLIGGRLLNVREV